MSGVERFGIPRDECLDLVAGRSVGRLCVLDQGYPVALPVNYRVTGEGHERRIVVRTGENTVISRHVGLTSLEVDRIDERERHAWSVVLRGTIHRVSAPHHLPDPEPWITEGRHVWLLLEVTAISGRRFEARTGADGFTVEWGFDAGH